MTIAAFFSRPTWRGVRVGLVCALALWLLGQTGSARGVEDWLLDSCFFFRGGRPTQARIVIIGLDEASFNQLNKPLIFISPELAEVVRYSEQQGAAAVGLDLYIPESLSTLPEIETAGQRGDARSLGQVILDAGNVVLPRRHEVKGWQRPLLQWQLKSLVQPEPGDLAFVDFTEDGDQLVRRQQLFIHSGEESVPHFSLALFARAQRAAIAWDDAKQELKVGGQPVPLDAEQKLRINFVGPPGTFPVLPFKDVLAAARTKQHLPELNGAIVLIGLTVHDQHDYHATPYANLYARHFSHDLSGLMAGTEIQAHIIATLQDRAFITTPWLLNPLLLLLVFGASLGWTFARLNLEWGLLLVVAHVVVWEAMALAAFSLLHWRIEMLTMQLLGVMTYGATFAMRWHSLRRMFGVVKSEAIALALEADPSQLDLGGEEREVTVLFADIRNFTDFCEVHTPHEVVALLNAYFTAIVPAIDAEKGTILNYMGDGVMVVFGAPASLLDHAPRAVRAAVAIVRRVHDLRDKWAQLGKPDLRIGVGVHTGKVVIGAIGSPHRLDYTAIGDVVNTASRIEAENKRLHTEVLISAATYAALPAEAGERLGCAAAPVEAAVKGKHELLYLYPLAVP